MLKDKTPTSPSLFGRENYIWMAIGLVVIAIGMFMMAGGKSTNPAIEFDDSIYSARRITVAPILILAGLVIEMFAIFRKPKNA